MSITTRPSRPILTDAQREAVRTANAARREAAKLRLAAALETMAPEHAEDYRRYLRDADRLSPLELEAFARQAEALWRQTPTVTGDELRALARQDRADLWGPM